MRVHHLNCITTCPLGGKLVLLVPLFGHTLGHAGVAVRRTHDWLLLAGDAYFYHAEMNDTPHCTPGLRFYQWMMEKDRRQRLHNQERLRTLRRESLGDVTIVCSHDVIEFERMAERAHDVPVLARSTLTPELPHLVTA